MTRQASAALRPTSRLITSAVQHALAPATEAVNGPISQRRRPETKAPQVFVSYASSDYDRAAALDARADGDRVRGLVRQGAPRPPGATGTRRSEAGWEAARVILPLLTPALAALARGRNTRPTRLIAVISRCSAEGTPEAVMPPPLRRWNSHALDPFDGRRGMGVPVRRYPAQKLAEPVPERAPCILDLPYPRQSLLHRPRRPIWCASMRNCIKPPVVALTQGRVRALAAMGGVGQDHARQRIRPPVLAALSADLVGGTRGRGWKSGFAAAVREAVPGPGPART